MPAAVDTAFVTGEARSTIIDFAEHWDRLDCCRFSRDTRGWHVFCSAA